MPSWEEFGELQERLATVMKERDDALAAWRSVLATEAKVRAKLTLCMELAKTRSSLIDELVQRIVVAEKQKEVV